MSIANNLARHDGKPPKWNTGNFISPSVKELPKRYSSSLNSLVQDYKEKVLGN